MSPQTWQRRIEQIMSRINHHVQRIITMENIRESMRSHGLRYREYVTEY